MSHSYFELTGMTREIYRATLHQIRATQDLPEHGVRAGEVGGWIEDPRNLCGRGWATKHAAVRDEAVVWGLVTQRAEVRDHAKVDAGAVVRGSAQVLGGGHMLTGAVAAGAATVWGTCAGEVTDDGLVPPRANVGADAVLRGFQDVLVLGPVGSESVWVTLWRTKSGHGLRVGCWLGHISELADKVAQRSREWAGERDCTAEDESRWRAEYAAIETLCRARIAGWGDA